MCVMSLDIEYMPMQQPNARSFYLACFNPSCHVLVSRTPRFDCKRGTQPQTYTSHVRPQLLKERMRVSDRSLHPPPALKGSRDFTSLTASVASIAPLKVHSRRGLEGRAPRASHGRRLVCLVSCDGRALPELRRRAEGESRRRWHAESRARRCDPTIAQRSAMVAAERQWIPLRARG